jgi:hypothetical protein
MKPRGIAFLGICTLIAGIVLILTADIGSSWKKTRVEEGSFEFSYPANWEEKQNREVQSFPATSELPATDQKILTIELSDRGKTIHVRINYFESDKPVNIRQAAEIQAEINASNKDYRLVELKDIVVNGRPAVRRIETYQIEGGQGPVLWTLVATYLSGKTGMYSILLVNTPWPDMQAHMEVYDQIVQSFNIIEKEVD